MHTKISLAISAALLAACGGDKVIDDDHSNEKPPVDYSQLQTTPQSTSSLVAISSEQLGQHLKNGIRLQLKSGWGFGGGAAAPSTGDSVNAGGRGNFSETNVHVEGVDEADAAKYDGSFWFVATSPYAFRGTQPLPPGFQIVATDPVTPDVEIVGNYQFDDEWSYANSLYLVQQKDHTSHVAAIRNQWGSVYPILPGFPIDLAVIDIARPPSTQTATIAPAAAIAPSRQHNSKVRVQLVDVTDPKSPEQDWEIELDGSLIDSRKIGNTLYLITRYDPWLPDLRFEAGDSRIRDQNEEILADTDISKLLPHYRIGASEYLISPRCLVQEGLKDNYGLGSLVYITAIDLAGQSVLGSTCVNSNVESMTMSPDALYLTGTVYDGRARGQHTVIHKFSLAETGPSYQATGSVPGSLGWSSDPVFRMHAHDDAFRIVTSSWDENGPQHKLSILAHRGNQLTTIAELPNAENPAPIGKPGEDIYAVRFTADRAYIVTFRRTDPLYALDLSSTYHPKILGELEIPGFATYLHPIGDKLLFTLGHSATSTGVVDGIKADLFDVSGDTPRLINTLNLGETGSYSEALNNLRALSLLQHSADQIRIAFPLTSYIGRATPADGFQRLEINGLDNGVPELKDVGTLVLDGNRTGSYGKNRAIFHDDAVFFTYNNAFWAGHWDHPNTVKGPISPIPPACDTAALPSLKVSVYGDNADPNVDFCKASVTAIRDRQEFILDPIPNHDLIAPSDGKPCLFSGAHETPGTFDIQTKMPGYQAQNLNGIIVPRDICHVITQDLRVVLKSE